MYAVGRLGSYITRGVYTVSGPFHPFGGAVDIVVVEQQDGSFKSSPWYVRFGKFQGVLKAKEKVVSININGVDADLQMYLDHKGEAYFLREVDVGEVVAEPYPLSSGDEMDGNSNSGMPVKSKSCSFVDDNKMDLGSHVEASNGKIVARTSSSRSKIFGLVFGRRSVKQNGFQEEENAAGVGRASSLERAEMAADLLEVEWSTNLATRKQQKDGGSNVSDPNPSVSNLDGKFDAASGRSDKCSFVQDGIENKVESFVPHDSDRFPNDSGSEKLDHPVKQTDSLLPCSTKPVNYVEMFTLKETYLEVDLMPEGSRFSSTADSRIVDKDENAKGDMSEISNPNSHISHSVDIEARISDEDNNSSTIVLLRSSSISETGYLIDEVPSLLYSETSETITGGLDGFCEKDNEALNSAPSLTRELHAHAEAFPESLKQILEVNSELQPVILATDQNVQNSNVTDCCGASYQSKRHESEKTSVSLTGNSIVQAELATESYIVDECTMKQGTVDSIDLVEEVVVVKEISDGEKASISSTGSSTVETELATESEIGHLFGIKQGPVEGLDLVEEATMETFEGEKTFRSSTGNTTVEAELATESDIGHQRTIKQGSVEDLNLVKLIKDTSGGGKTSISSIGNCTVQDELALELDIGHECMTRHGPLEDIMSVEEVIKESVESQKTSMTSTENDTVEVELATESDIGHECTMKHGPVEGINVVEEEDSFEGEKTSVSSTGNSSIEAEVVTESDVSHQCAMTQGPMEEIDLAEQVADVEKSLMTSIGNSTVKADLATDSDIGHQCGMKQGPVDDIKFVEEIVKETSEGDKTSMCSTVSNAVKAEHARESDIGNQCTMKQGPAEDIDLLEEEANKSYEGEKISTSSTGNITLFKAADAELSTDSYTCDECYVKQGGMDNINLVEEEVTETSGAEKISLCSTGNSTIFEVVEGEFATEADIGHQCMVKRQPVEDIGVVDEVVKKAPCCPELYLGSSSVTPESELRLEDPCTMGNSFHSILSVSDEHNFACDMSGRSSNAKECNGDDVLENTGKEASSASSEEEQFALSDVDDPKVQDVDHMECASSYPVANEYHPHDFTESGREEVNQSTSRHDESHSCREMVIQEDQLNDHPIQVINVEWTSSPISFPRVHKDADLESLSQIVESLPRMRTHSYGYRPLSCSLDSNFEGLILMENNYPDLGSKTEKVSGAEDPTVDASQISEELKKIISDPAVELSLCRHLLYEGMGYEAASRAFDAEKLSIDRFVSLGPEIMKNEKLVVRIGGLYFPWDAALPIASAIGSNGSQQILEPKGMIAVDQVEKTAEGNAQKSTDSKSTSWRLWPFSFQRSKSVENRNSDSENSSESNRGKVSDTDRDFHKPKDTKKRIRANTPTSEQLASLNLKEGKNVVTFTFSTAMLGEQKVDARIFVWKWNTKIVISDVDGTITKSDVLGQFMPLVGLDWSQTGVAHLFSAIKENGYQLLFLSARSISQAYTTRQFLFNLKQDGKALPEGPVVISPDGLFPSLYREVIRRAPHEFKIACLEDIKALFPPDSNPFYAGFGNRDTDEISYLKVGIPKGKIFIINPKGQIAVNRRVDNKSYTSLYTLVHDMFPATSSHEQEDYNSWNFWRLPPPGIDF